MDVGYFLPGQEKLVLANSLSKKIIVIEDIVGEGKTYRLFCKYMAINFPEINYVFIPIVIAGEHIHGHSFKIYGLKTEHWAVGPYDEPEKVVDGLVGYFRDKTDKYGG